MSLCSWAMFHRLCLFTGCEMSGRLLYPCHNWCVLIPSGAVRRAAPSGGAQWRLALSEKRIQPRDHLSLRITAWQHKYSPTSLKPRLAPRTDGHESWEMKELIQTKHFLSQWKGMNEYKANSHRFKMIANTKDYRIPLSLKETLLILLFYIVSSWNCSFSISYYRWTWC